MLTLNFNLNYNSKLDCRFFTTIREFSLPQDEIVEVRLRDHFYIKAKCLYNVQKKLSEVSVFDLMLDTGYTYSESLLLFESLQIKENDIINFLMMENLTYQQPDLAILSSFREKKGFVENFEVPIKKLCNCEKPNKAGFLPFCSNCGNHFK